MNNEQVNQANYDDLKDENRRLQNLLDDHEKWRDSAMSDLTGIEKELNAMRAVAHNFYVTVKPWLHHESDMLKASISDLRHELAKGEKSGVYLY